MLADKKIKTERKKFSCHFPLDDFPKWKTQKREINQEEKLIFP